MPTYKFEAMDTTGGEVKDSVEATNEEEAQQKIRQMGYFVTRLTEVAGKKEKKKAKGPRKGKKGKVFTLGGVKSKMLVTFAPSSRPCRTPACPCSAVSRSSKAR